jgi:hypothetical protein
MNEAHSQFAEYSTSILVIRNLLHLCELCRVIGFSVEFPIFSNMQTHFFYFSIFESCTHPPLDKRVDHFDTISVPMFNL